MKKFTAVLTTTVQKLADPKNIRIMMFLLPVIIGFGFGEAGLLDVGGNAGGCTGG